MEYGNRSFLFSEDPRDPVQRQAVQSSLQLFGPQLDVNNDWKRDENKRQAQEHFGKSFEQPFYLDCPFCRDFESVIVELNDEKLDEAIVLASRMICINCGTMVERNHPFLADALLSDELSKLSSEILKGYGFIEPHTVTCNQFVDEERIERD